MLEVFLDSLLDTLKILPFLLLAYSLIEVLESHSISQPKMMRIFQGKYAPLFGASFGLVPQCGFSVVATDLFSKKYISMGSLMAVYIATSDEAIPIILSNPSKIFMILPILIIKFIFAMVVGYSVDLIRKPTLVVKETKVYNAEEEGGLFKRYFLQPFFHSLKISAYILVVNFILGAIIFYVGETALNNFLLKSSGVQPILAAILGLIPNCASSVVITQLYLGGGLTLAGCISGLCVNSGVAYTVLFKNNKNIKENLFIIGLLFALSVILGYFVMIFQ